MQPTLRYVEQRSIPRCAGGTAATTGYANHGICVNTTHGSNCAWKSKAASVLWMWAMAEVWGDSARSCVAAWTAELRPLVLVVRLEL